MNLLIGKDGQQLGPFSEEQVRSMVQAGMLNSGDQAWHDGLENWQPLWQLLGGPPPLRPAPPALPTPPTSTGEEPWRLIGAGWSIAILSLIPASNILTVPAALVLAIILVRHRNAKARWHGKILFCVWGVSLLVALFVLAILMG